MLTWPHTSSPNPINTHHIHWSSCRGEQLNGFPPNWTITICKEKQKRKRVNIFWEKNPQSKILPRKKTKPHQKNPQPNNFQSYFTWDFYFCLSTYYISAGLIPTYFASRIIKHIINNLFFSGLNLKGTQNTILYFKYVIWRSRVAPSQATRRTFLEPIQQKLQNLSH